MAKADKQETPTQYAVRLNSGAANAVATGNLIEGMDYTHSTSHDLREDPIVQMTMAIAKTYQSKIQKFQTAYEKWENTPENKRDKEPKLSPTHELIGARASYENVVQASQIRANKFHEFYNKQTAREARESTFHKGYLPNNLSEEAKKTIENIDKRTALKNLDENSLEAKSMTAIEKFHILGKTTKDIKEYILTKELDALHNPQPQTA